MNADSGVHFAGQEFQRGKKTIFEGMSISFYLFFITIKLMASVGFAKLLRIRVRIYSVVKAASPPKINVLKF
jgi:hypothetical protein